MLGVGAQFGEYRIDGVLGRGGMGIVYKATHRVIGRSVALKLMLDDDDLVGDASFRERFLRESRLAASIDHPNVLPVYDAGELDGRLFITMRLVEGMDLAQILARNPQGLEIKRAVGLLSQAAAALDSAHRRGLVHRDVKPANILVSDEDGEHVYLSDFGLTRLVAGETLLTSKDSFVGTAAYCAPEQISGGRVGPAADVYALGCVLFHMLTGRQPFERETQIAVIYAQLNDPVPNLRLIAPSVPDALACVVERAMAKSASERYESAGDLGRAAVAAIQPSASGMPKPMSAGPAAPARDESAANLSASPVGRSSSAPSAAPVRRRGILRRPVAVLSLAMIAATAFGVLALSGMLSVGASAVSSDRAEAVVQRYLDSYRTEDLDAVIATLTPDVTLEAMTKPLGVTINKNGRQEVRDAYQSEFERGDKSDLSARIQRTDTSEDATTVTVRSVEKNVTGGFRAVGTTSYKVVEVDGRPLIETIRDRSTLS